MKARHLIPCLMLLSAGCGGSASSDGEAGAQGSLTTERVADIAGAIASNPAGADSIMSNSGITREQLDAALYDIAADALKRTGFLERLGNLVN
jgi:hypothetical protein